MSKLSFLFRADIYKLLKSVGFSVSKDNVFECLYNFSSSMVFKQTHVFTTDYEIRCMWETESDFLPIKGNNISIHRLVVDSFEEYISSNDKVVDEYMKTSDINAEVISNGVIDGPYIVERVSFNQFAERDNKIRPHIFCQHKLTLSPKK